MEYQFNDALGELIDRHGGRSPQNLQEIAIQVREFKPTFSAKYLQLLLIGHPPDADDRRAISEVLVPRGDRWMCQFWRLEDTVPRTLAKGALRCTKSHQLAKDFVNWCDNTASFRDPVTDFNDIAALCTDYLRHQQCVDEPDLFSLPISGRYEV